MADDFDPEKARALLLSSILLVSDTMIANEPELIEIVLTKMKAPHDAAARQALAMCLHMLRELYTVAENIDASKLNNAAAPRH